MTHEEVDNLIQDLNKHFEKIVKFLFTPDRQGHSHFDDYLFLVKNFKGGNFDDEFKRVYKRFWLVGDFGNFNQELRNKYFELLSEKETDLYTILIILKEISPGRLWPVFATKLIHTIDNYSPIYDSYVAEELTLRRRDGNKKDKDIKILKDIEIFCDLRGIYITLFNNADFRDIINKFREILKEKYNEDYRLITDTKIADSLIWALHIVKKKI